MSDIEIIHGFDEEGKLREMDLIMPMKAITLWQPWGTLKVKRVKKYETRSWATSYRGPMAIHAAKKPTHKVLKQISAEYDRSGSLEALQVWHTLMSCLRECSADTMAMPYTDFITYALEHETLPTGAVLGYGNLIACHLITPEFVAELSPIEIALGDFTPGRYAWEFEDMVEFETPIPAKGKQRLWNWEMKSNESIVARFV